MNSEHGSENGSAIIRRCDVCGIVNAIDLDWSKKHERDLQLLNHTVIRVTEAEAMKLWKGAGKCNHKELVATLRAQLVSQNFNTEKS